MILPSFPTLVPNGPQVGVPVATSEGWLKLKHNAGSPGFAEITVNKWRLNELR
jgi:hypothetical protein